MTDSVARIAERACHELADVARRLPASAVEPLMTAIVRARRIAVYGVGREGLMMKALAMRLFHLGLDAHVVGDMTVPPLGAGDLLIVSAGPGDLSTVNGLIGVAKGAGARVACVTAQPDGVAPKRADVVLHIPAQTMADDGEAVATSILPMGSVFEGAQFVVFEALVLTLRDRLDIAAEAMRANHTNLE